MTPTVSVAMGTFNGARYLPEQVASIIGQSRPPDEIVVSDDGSSDATLAVLEDVRRSGAPVRVLPPGERLGVTGNFERAIAACTGDLIVLSDQDDIWHVDRVATMLARFSGRPELLLQHSDARLVDENGASLGVDLFEALRVSPRERELIHGGHAFEVFLRRNLATGATVMFRRELAERAAPFPPSWVHDEWLAIVAASVGGVDLVDSALIDYRQHGGNQIGVVKASLRHRVSRLFEPRGERLPVLAARSAVLASRLDGASVEVAAAARGKAAFEATRAGYPKARLGRLGPVLRQLRRGGYDRYASQARLDAVRDLLQPG